MKTSTLQKPRERVKPETTTPAVTRHCENVRHDENEVLKKTLAWNWAHLASGPLYKQIKYTSEEIYYGNRWPCNNWHYFYFLHKLLTRSIHINSLFFSLPTSQYFSLSRFPFKHGTPLQRDYNLPFMKCKPYIPSYCFQLWHYLKHVRINLQNNFQGRFQTNFSHI